MRLVKSADCRILNERHGQWVTENRKWYHYARHRLLLSWSGPLGFLGRQPLAMGYQKSDVRCAFRSRLVWFCSCSPLSSIGACQRRAQLFERGGFSQRITGCIEQFFDARVFWHAYWRTTFLNALAAACVGLLFAEMFSGHMFLKINSHLIAAKFGASPPSCNFNRKGLT